MRSGSLMVSRTVAFTVFENSTRRTCVRFHLRKKNCRLMSKIALLPTPSLGNPHSYAEHESYMSEIQLRRIVDKMANESADQGTDGDEVMQKGGENISKFSKEALEIGAAVDEIILEKVRKVFDLNKRDDAVFRTKNGAPKIMTKFKDKPYFV